MVGIGESDPRHSRIVFQGLVDALGTTTMRSIFDMADQTIASGLEGLTLPTEDHSVMITVEKSRISFSLHGWGPYVLPRVDASDILSAMQENPGS